VNASGVAIAYNITGAGPAVACIQGVGVAGSGWRPQVAALARQHSVITFDHRGLGASGTGPAPLTIGQMADDLIAILDAERIERAHLVGHSMGGLVALQVALARRERVRSLSLLCTFADGAAPGRLSWRMVVLGLRSRVGTKVMRRHGMMRMIMPPGYLRRVDGAALGRELSELFGRDLADQPPIVGMQLRAMARVNLTPQLRELGGIPTLVISATHDPIAPPSLGRAIADGIEGARFVEVHDASHALPIQSPDQINTLLVEHLEASAR
jgi:pimeloyl-ACP methyl ester carboxylesterase